ncbi:hypothetical protein [Modestobacter sp. DSM 44400]|uniref:hypothetical protein n=1 Tax=Modestobacter sp. DSM 44400 TaxID=1550230 RepID=UPI00111521D2|nr:hypothetical protein [Modestobacter sp. DSM 44400]
MRRVRHAAADLSADPRAGRRRTIPQEQLTLALDGELDAVYGYSVIATNLPTDTPAQAVGIEAWYRGRTDIEGRFRDAKHAQARSALIHLPSADPGVNTAWLWAALLALALSGRDYRRIRGRSASAWRIRAESAVLPGQDHASTGVPARVTSRSCLRQVRP